MTPYRHPSERDSYEEPHVASDDVPMPTSPWMWWLAFAIVVALQGEAWVWTVVRVAR